MEKPSACVSRCAFTSTITPQHFSEAFDDSFDVCGTDGVVCDAGTGIACKIYFADVQYKKEVEILASLSHVNIISLLCCDLMSLTIWFPRYDFDLVKAYQLGCSPHPLLVCKQMLAALDYCANRCVVHADVKNDNILVRRGECVLCDFARAVHIFESVIFRRFLGTLAYGAPEALNCLCGTCNDVWSLGIAIYALGEGSFPSDGDIDVLQLLTCPWRLRGTNFPWPLQLRRFLVHALQRNMFQRLRAQTLLQNLHSAESNV